MKSRDEFKAGLLAFGERVQKFRGHLKNEEATKLSLVQPFITLLGYDPLDPTEVAAEYSADFSEKYKNRVDYVIKRGEYPVIAIECKSVGGAKKDDRGQLKAYFNAVKQIKIGILTDGAVFEFFVDSNEPNMMDEEPYLTVDFEKVVKGELADTELDGLFSLAKGNFEPDSVGESARRSITYRLLFDYLTEQFSMPCNEFTRFLLKEVDIKNVRTNAIDTYRDIARSAFKDVFNASVLRKLDIQGVPPGSQKMATPAEASVDAPAVGQSEKSIVTTDAEKEAFESVKLRLAFLLSGSTELFDKITNIKYRDYQQKMIVFYGMERKGRILDILESKDGVIRYVLFDGGDPTPVSELSALDARLKNIYLQRVAEFG
jgi:hypothetical protein